MADEQLPAQVETSETPIESVPTDFRQYDHWRRTGELPAKAEETPPAAAAETPQAKTGPHSGAGEDQTEEDEEEVQEGRPRRSSSRQRRIDKLTRENEELKQQIANMPKPAASEPMAQPEQPGKPKLVNFKSLEEYQEALTDWKLDQREKAKKAAQEQTNAENAEKKLQTEWDSRQNASRSAHADYDDVIESVAAPEGPGVLAARQAMLEDDAGPETLYHLATHPDDLNRIAALPPIAAVKEIGRLSVLLAPSSSATGNPKPKVSSAPKPPPSLTRPAKTATDSIYDEDLARGDYRKWEKARVAQLKER